VRRSSPGRQAAHLGGGLLLLLLPLPLQDLERALLKEHVLTRYELCKLALTALALLGADAARLGGRSVARQVGNRLGRALEL
jgi:hypothetical protein